jgi:hypothetical protein
MLVRLLLATGIVCTFSHASAAHADNILELTVNSLKLQGTQEFKSFCDERVGRASSKTKGQRETHTCRFEEGALTVVFEADEPIRARATVPEEPGWQLLSYMKYAFGDDFENLSDGRMKYLWDKPDLKARLTEASNPARTTVEITLRSGANGGSTASVDVPTSTQYPLHWAYWTLAKVAAAFFDMRAPADFQRWCDGVGGRRPAAIHPKRLEPFTVEGETTLTCDNVDAIYYGVGKGRFRESWPFIFGVRFDKHNHLRAAFAREDEIASPYNHYPYDNALAELVWRLGDHSEIADGMYHWSPGEGILVRLANRRSEGSLLMIDAPGRTLKDVRQALHLGNRPQRPNPPKWEDLPAYCKRYKRVQDCPRFKKDVHGDCRYENGALNVISPKNAIRTRSLAGEPAWCSRPCLKSDPYNAARAQSYCCAPIDEPPSSQCPTFH